MAENKMAKGNPPKKTKQNTHTKKSNNRKSKWPLSENC
jgi:hypothetical protein